MNKNKNQQQNENEHIDQELNQLTQTLRDLNIQQRELRRQSFEVQQQIQQLNRRRTTGRVVNRRDRTPRRDRHRDRIDVGDYVNFLTAGRFNTRSGTITQISHRRYVSARDREQRIINREPANVEIVRKYNQQHDQ